MKDKKTRKKALSFKITEEDHERIRKIIGPYGTVSRFIRDIIFQHLDKLEKKNNAA